MKTPFPVFLTVLVFSFSFNWRVWGQQDSSDPQEQFAELVERAYGQDQELVNGRRYYNRYPLCKGNPYLFDGIMQQGSVTLRGDRYQKLLIRYDIHNQQVEIEYSTLNGAPDRVVLVRGRVDAFMIGPLFFQSLEMDGDQEGFYQVAGYGKMIFYIRWEKRRVPLHNDTKFLEEYTSARNHIMVKIDNEVHYLRSRRHFKQLLPVPMYRDVKKLFRAHALNFRNATPVELDLILKEVSVMFNEGYL